MSKHRLHGDKTSASRSSVPSSSDDRFPVDSEAFPVVAIGASAGGLDACRKLLDALPSEVGVAFILVQHLNPTHESMLADLLSSHTSMTVRQAAEGMPIEADHLYVIAPGTYLSIAGGNLHLTEPAAPHGARLPFDFLLNSMAEEFGARAICVILSGTGADGSIGLKAVKDKGGRVIAQDPEEASYEGMPRSAISTGSVDRVLATAEMPDAIVEFGRLMAPGAAGDGSPPPSANNLLPEVVELLRTKTAHDFRLYKPGTLQRRIERRVAMAGKETEDWGGYLRMLKDNANELDLLAKDLLINVTSFFRDPKVFSFLAEKIVPELIRNQSADQPLRIWVAGCSTGEETYSLAMLFREAIAETKSSVKLQVFASDADADAVAEAREGLYPETMMADVSPERLARFFTKEKSNYRVAPELRAAIVFTVQDVLADPPFSRLDFISCRNLLIYLRPEAQAKVVSLFHFALREGGLLLLGAAETVGAADGRFEPVSKAARLYRHIGRSRPGDISFLLNDDDNGRLPVRGAKARTPSRQTALGDLCRRLVMEAYAPAAVLIDRKHECLYSMGPTERYLQVPRGAPTQDLLAMARPGLRTKLRSAIHLASQENARIVVGGQITHEGVSESFSIAVQPVRSDGEDLLLICFNDEPKLEQKPNLAAAPQDVSRVAELEHELEATRTELQAAVRNLEVSWQEQKAINQEALSVNEEFQATNEELLTSKEELQSLNEELTALNSQLQETLERQRTTSDDLQNILYSTDVATIFLDANLKIRFFTPATKSLFNFIPGDIGRPLVDLASLASDNALLTDAKEVLRNQTPIEKEIEAQSGAWYVRRILPYRTQDNRADGVVIIFADVTERKRTADVLAAAKRRAEVADVAKSRFLAAASHDLRQPLQTLALLQGLLARNIEGEKPQRLVRRIDETLGAMTGMLNTLLDINQIKSGTVQVEKIDFTLNDLLVRLQNEFTYQAQAHNLSLRMVPCSLSIRSDPRLLEQMIRNLISNALKYTKSGKILFGCRRHRETLSIEVWDTGIGIPDAELQTIFEEYYQVDNAARERSRGLGLGLSIVQRLGELLDHKLRVRSHHGAGSVFSIEVKVPPKLKELLPEQSWHGVDDGGREGIHRRGAILVVEDDPEVRELLELFLKEDGHRVTAVSQGPEALEWVTQGDVGPDIILTDYNLPNQMNGVELVAKMREMLHRAIPGIVVTGDISTATLRDIASNDCVQLNKPVKLNEIARAIQRALARLQTASIASAPPTEDMAQNSGEPVIYVVDDDDKLREALRGLLEGEGRTVKDYASCEAFLDAYKPGVEACLLVDANLPGMKGLELLESLKGRGILPPAIMITGHADVSMAVQAMKAGTSDFIEKPFSHDELIASVARALERAQDASKHAAWRENAASHIARLTPRQQQIMDMLLAGHPNKNIAADLGISQHTIENHRAAIMKRMGVRSLPALARLVLAEAD